jgi:hypothetical protein
MKAKTMLLIAAMASLLASAACFCSPFISSSVTSVSFLNSPLSASLHARKLRPSTRWWCSAQKIATERIQIGTLEVSSMGMGTLNWPLNKAVDSEAAAAMKACIDNGIDFFDTAEAYGFGTSEKLTRSCIEAIGATNAKVATKFAPVPWRQDASDVVSACKASAERLGVKSIDLCEFHPLAKSGAEQHMAP